MDEICYDMENQSLHGLACGRDSDKLILCLHGWLDNAASFVPMMPYFNNKRVIAIDWPGHGFSSHRSLDAHYHFVDWVYDLVQLFELSQWQKVDIVAHSMGAMVASAFAAAFPDKVNSLTLIDSIGFISAEPEKATEQLRDGMLSRLKHHKKQKKFHATIESAVQARVNVSNLSTEQAEIIVKRGLVKEAAGYVWCSDSRLRNTSPYRITIKQAEQFIKDIQIPVQLIYGSKGFDMVPAAIKHFGPLFKQFASYQLQGGHHVHMEKPKEIVELIESFMQQNG